VTNALDGIEGEGCLAFGDVGWQVKFQYEKHNGLFTVLDVVLVWEGGHACPDMLAPLASDII
jgi:hypothetical protein